jgi:hypothetical protein
VFGRSAHDEGLAVRRAPLFRNLDLQGARNVTPRDRFGRARDVVGRPDGHDLAAMRARAGAEVYDVIGPADRLFVVFDHEHRVAQVAQLGERVEQPFVVARVQSDRRLVEHVEYAAQLRADLRGQADALSFAAGQRRRRTV